MIDYGDRVPSVDKITAAFPHKILEKISGTPSQIDIDDAQEKQTENSASNSEPTFVGSLLSQLIRVKSALQQSWRVVN